MFGRKRKLEQEEEEEGTESIRIKRRRSNDNNLSVFDRVISSFGGWLRRSFGRKTRPNTMSTEDQPSPPDSSHSPPSPSHSPPGPSHSHEVIVISDDDKDEIRGHDLKNKGGYNDGSSCTVPPLEARGRDMPKSSNRFTSNYRQKTSIYKSSPVLDSWRKKEDEILFKKLMDSKMSNAPDYSTRDVQATPIATPSFHPKLYSTADTPVAGNHHHTASNGPLVSTPDCYGNNRHLLHNRAHYVSRGGVSRDPSVSLGQSLPSRDTVPIYKPRPKPTVPAPVIIEAKGTSNRKQETRDQAPPLPLSPPPLFASRINGGFASTDSNSSSELSNWIYNMKQQFDERASDRQAKLEVAMKYFKIHQEGRMKAEEVRAEKLKDRMKRLTLRSWSPGIEEEPEAELNLMLDQDTIKLVQDIWSGRLHLRDQVLSKGYNIEIKRMDLLTLRGLEWLNDEVINFYLNLVAESANSEGEKRVHLFNSFFYPKIMSAGYSGVRRWTKKVDIFNFDLILLPIHLGMHWCLAAIDFNNKTINYYDSLKGNNTRCLNTLKDYLVSEAKDKKQLVYDVSDWTLECIEDIPEQHNGSDCGVFTCMYARHLARGKPFNFSQDDMPDIRQLMVAEIVNKKLL
ncbi:PREDICTED: sentrin-specific protease 1-like [Amphimedon queenslandica]|uniref:Ubiquitin-like protease family profile domain-containing protein n=1 Tax=Amphimedon queenslandica TaxID=400682 RepID=A0A1X7VRT5_AMPQE|nr:PREDICTED: sentrin-specific protease 1-like [Amphimedon queenslandica]|eukprot:XP_019857195.1 PREDICTED: sentrin-specific protease 1-like [Amphimedon queenslandica]